MKLSRMVTGLLSVALLAFMVSDSLGQDQGRRGGDRGGQRGGGQRGGPGGGGFGGRGGPGGGGGDPTMSLLRMEEVKTELQIGPDQDAALTKLAEQARGERPDADFRSMSDEERNDFFAKMRKQQEERTKQMKEQLEEVLLPEQIERLEQIGLQVRGVQALNDEEVAAALKISAEQKKELEEVGEKLRSEMGNKMRELFSSGNRDGMREAFAKMREDMEKEVLGVLSTDQQKQFEEMKGEKFDMPEGGFGRGGFGGGPGGGRPGGGGAGRPGGGRGQGGRGRPGGEGGGRRRPPTDE